MWGHALTACLPRCAISSPAHPPAAPPLLPRAQASGDEEPSSGISQALPLAELAGLWVKDSAASQLDAYERMMDMWQVGVGGGTGEV